VAHDPKAERLVQRLHDVDIDGMTPLQALSLLADLKADLKKDTASCGGNKEGFPSGFCCR
jgi:hypothetical protein